MRDFDIQRPRLLMSAARFGLIGYEDSEAKTETLIAREKDMENARVAGLESYSIADHVEALTALIARGRQMRRAGQ